LWATKPYSLAVRLFYLFALLININHGLPVIIEQAWFGQSSIFTGGLDYRYLSPTFKVDNGLLSDEATQKISVLKLGVGIGINFKTLL